MGRASRKKWVRRNVRWFLLLRAHGAGSEAVREYVNRFRHWRIARGVFTRQP